MCCQANIFNSAGALHWMWKRGNLERTTLTLHLNMIWRCEDTGVLWDCSKINTTYINFSLFLIKIDMSITRLHVGIIPFDRKFCVHWERIGSPAHNHQTVMWPLFYWSRFFQLGVLYYGTFNTAEAQYCLCVKMRKQNKLSIL